MFKHAWSILCDDISISESDGSMSVIGVTHQININNQIPKKQRNNKPLHLPLKKKIVTMWHLDDLDTSKTYFSIRLRHPNGSYMEDDCPAMILQSEPWQRTNVGIDTMLISDSGTYCFEMMLKANDGEWKTVAEMPISVHVIDDAPRVSENT